MFNSMEFSSVKEYLLPSFFSALTATQSSSQGTFDISGVLFNVCSILIYLTFSVALSIYILYHFTKRNRLEWYSYVCLGFTYWIGFGSVAIITIDLASAIYKNPTSPEVFTLLHMFWIVVYWSVQILAWIVIPILQAYVEQGHFSTWRKILGALFENVVLYIVFFVVLGAAGAAVLLFLVIKTTTEHSSSVGDLLLGIPDMVMQASNIFGMTLLFVLLGYGVVALPRSLWYRADHDRHLDLLAFKASHASDTIDEKREKLGEMIAALDSLAESIDESSPLYPKVQKLLQKKTHLYDRYQISALRGTTHDKIKPTNSGIVKFHRKFIKNVRQFRKKRYELKNIEYRAFFVQDVIRAKKSKSGRITGPFRTPKTRFFPEYRERLEYWWYCVLYKPVLRLFSIFVALFCLAVVWCELSIIIYTLSDGSLNLSIFSHLVNVFTFNRPLVQIVSLLLMAGVMCIIYFALFQFRFSDFYALVPGHSDSPTMLFTAVILTRVVPALLLNFVLILHAGEGSKDDPGVAFFRVNTRLSLDKLKIVVLATWILDYYPLLIVVVALSTLCAATFLSRLSFLCGNIHDYVFHRKKSLENIQEGRRIIILAKKRMAREKSIDYDSEIDKFDQMESGLQDDDSLSSALSDMDDIGMEPSRANPGDVHISIGDRDVHLKEVTYSDQSSSDDSMDIGERRNKYSKNTMKRLEAMYKKRGKTLPSSFRR